MDSAALARLPFERRDDVALYERILQDRVEGRLGAWLSERELLERYQVKRATLQHTIERLMREGVLRRRRGRGWEFEAALDSVSSERESYGFRLMLECAALMEPGFRLGSGDEKTIDRRSVARGPMVEPRPCRNCMGHACPQSKTPTFRLASACGLSR